MLQRLITHVLKLNSLYLGTILFVVTFSCYANTLGNGLFFDDEQFIYNNQSVQALDISTIFSTSLVSGGGKLSNYYRPILFTGFGIEYQLFKKNGFIYHFNSALLHFFGGLLLYLLLHKLFKSKSLALLTALFFLIHPIQTEAVSYASGRGDPLSFFFVMLSLLLSLSGSKKYRVIAPVCFIFALLSKELAIITPGLIFLTHLFNEKSLSKTALVRSFRATLPFAIVAIIYFLLRISILNFSNTLNFYNSANVYSTSLFVRLNTFLHLFPAYVQLLIFPKELFMERDSGISIQILPTIQSLFTLIFLVGAVVFAFIKKITQPVFLFGIGWIAVTFIPTSGIIPINGIFYEHFLYYPSVGFFLIISYAIRYLYIKATPISKELILALLFILIFLLSARTVLRNREWNNPVEFYTQTLSHVQSPRAYNNLAMAYAEIHDANRSIINYKKAILLNDTYPETHFNLANAYLAIANKSSAETEYKTALRIDPSFYPAYGRLYQLYKDSDNTRGIEWIKESLTDLGKKYPSYLEYLHQLETR